MPRRAAGIDVGTNSIKTVIGELEPDGGVLILQNLSANARLGEGSDASGRLLPEAQGRAIEAIRAQLTAARELGAETIRAVGTSAIRDAANREEFVSQVHSELGLVIEPISEKDEARLAYQSVALDPALRHFAGEQMVFDIGGGSTEMIFGRGEHWTHGESSRIGAVRLTERFLAWPVTPSGLIDASSLSEGLIRSVCQGRTVERVVGIGGSVINLARIMLKLPKERTAEAHAVEMNRNDVRALLDKLFAHSPDERKMLPGLEPERADIILGGAVILERILAVLGAQSFTISTRGLRHALIYELLNNGAN